MQTLRLVGYSVSNSNSDSDSNPNIAVYYDDFDDIYIVNYSFKPGANLFYVYRRDRKAAGRKIPVPDQSFSSENGASELRNDARSDNERPFREND
jgi:hypothetical protein